jgi:hypothetical protein
MSNKVKQNFVAIKGDYKRGYIPMAVYEVTKKGLSYVGNVRYQPASTPGEETEVMRALHASGKLRPVIVKRLKRNMERFDPKKPYTWYYTWRFGAEVGLGIQILSAPERFYLAYNLSE